MTWLLIVTLVWGTLSIGMAIFIGRVLRLANGDVAPAAWTDEVEDFLREHSLREHSRPPLRPTSPGPASSV